MKILEVKTGEGWVRYKSESEIEPGFYFDLPRGIQDRQLGKLLGIIHTQNNGRYFRLLSYPLSAYQFRLLGLETKVKSLTSPDPIMYPAGFTPRKWQHQVMKIISSQEKTRLGVVIGLGGGKTALSVLIPQFARKKAIVICPPHLMTTVEQEAEKFGVKCPDLSTYESIEKCNPDLYDVCFFDEPLKMKNPSAKRTRDCMTFAKNMRLCLGGTGTPMSGCDYLDLRWINPVIGNEVFPSDENRFKFGLAKEVVEVEHKKGEKHKEIKSWNIDLISYLGDGHFFTVDTSELMKEVPPVRYEKIICPTPKNYTSALWRQYTESKSRAVVQARTCTDGFIYDDQGVAHHFMHTPKLDELIHLLSKFADMEPPQKVIIWVHWRASQEKLREKIGSKLGADKLACLFADMTAKEMQTEQEKFASPDCLFFLCSSELSEGMNLQFCSVEIFYSNSMSSVKREQAIGRVNRPGQTGQPYVIDLVCANTLDEKLLALLSEHKEMNEAFINSELEKELQ